MAACPAAACPPAACPGAAYKEAAGIRFDANARIAYVGDGPLRLTRREPDLLAAFLAEPHRELSRQELHDRVWGRLDTAFLAVDAYVSRLRARLRSVGRRRIGTVRMRGYLMLSPSRMN